MQNWTSRAYRREDKIYRGAFHYFRNENIYAEETFDVYRDKREQTYHYISETIVKVTTGETLHIHVEYIVNKNYVPTFVLVEKMMGKEVSREVYEYNLKRNHLLYNYSSSKTKMEVHTDEIPTAPKYHITTPTAASSMLFMRSKKLDASGKNSFNILVGYNQWDYKEVPIFKNVIIERASITTEKINIDGQSVQAIQYRMFEEIENQNAKDPKDIKDHSQVKIFLSQHGGIPYLLRTEDGTRIQIKYLNDLSDKE